MKRNKENKVKNKKEHKKIGIKITLLVLFIIIILTGMYFYFGSKNVNEENTIVAKKVILEENEQNRDIKYTIKIEDYNIASAIKEITFETEEEAQSEYNKYETINRYERREIGLELKKKKLILTMPEKQLLQDIEYSEENLTTLITENRRTKTSN